MKRPMVLLSLLLLGGAIAQSNPIDFPALTKRKAYKRWAWAFEQRAYPGQTVPAGNLTQALRLAQQNAGGFRQQGLTGWRMMGPAPLVNSQIGNVRVARPVSGRVSDIVVHPTDPNHWLVGSAAGGIWETRDGGTTWKSITDGFPTQTIGAIGWAPSNPNTIYAGTGEGNYTFAGEGIYRSTDGGASWVTSGEEEFAKTSVTAIRVNPLSEDQLYISSSIGFVGKAAAWPEPEKMPGVFSSKDGGRTWTRLLEGETNDLAVHPQNFQQLYAGQAADWGLGSGTIMRSSNGGTDWSTIEGPWSSMENTVGRIAFALAPSNPNMLYVAIADGFDGEGSDGGLLGLWRSKNAWASTPTWEKIDTTETDGVGGMSSFCGWDAAFESPSNQCWYNLKLSVDPENENTLFAGGIASWRWKDGKWSEVSNTATNQIQGIHVDQHAMAWAGNRLIAGNDGGVWSTTNQGTTWDSHNTDLNITQFYYGSIHPTKPDILIGGAQDNGTSVRANVNSNGWSHIGWGDGSDNFFNVQNPDNQLMVSNQYLSLYRLTRQPNGEFEELYAANDLDSQESSFDVYPFIAVAESCASNSNVVLGGTDNLWRSNDFFSAPADPAWTQNSPNLPADSRGRGQRVSAIAFFAGDPTCNTYAYGTNQGNVFLTVDGGKAWKTLTMNLPNRYVTEVNFGKSAGEVYVSLSGYNSNTPSKPGHIFKNENAVTDPMGWKDISTPTDVPHNTLLVDPVARTLYAGTDVGLWFSTNDGASWKAFTPQDGLPNVPMYNLQINRAHNRLVAFTHGRGAYALDLAPVSANLGLSGYIQATSFDVGSTFTVKQTIQNAGPSLATAVMLNWNLPAGLQYVSATGTNATCTPTGCTVLDLQSGASAQVDLELKVTAAGKWNYQAALTALSPDPVMQNNNLSVEAAFSSTVTVNPTVSDQTVKTEATGVSMLSFKVAALDRPVVLKSLTLRASGSGNDQLVKKVKVFIDQNNNGQVDAGEVLVGEGQFSQNDGTLKVTLNQPYTVPANTSVNFVVAYDFGVSTAGTVAGGMLVGLGGLGLLAARRRRRHWAVLAAGAVLMSSCNAVVVPVSRLAGDYQVTLEQVEMTVEGQVATFNGTLPLRGSKITILP